MKLLPVALLLVLSPALGATQAEQQPVRQMAITIDDLPANCTCDPAAWQDLTDGLLAHLTERRVPAIGFVNEVKLYPDLSGPDRIARWDIAVPPVDLDEIEPSPRRVALLAQWLEAGLELGNHTFSHPDLHRVELADYQSEILRGERVTQDLLPAGARGTEGMPLWFRHPFLHSGRSAEVKDDLDRFLAEHGYRIAPVTIDNGEWIFARAYDLALDGQDADAPNLARRVADAYLDYMLRQTEFFESQTTKLLGRDMPQVLLLHANRLNGAVLGELLDRLARRGYEFVPLAAAMQDPAYGRADAYFGPAGMSWVQRWAWGEGHRGSWFAGEPEVDDWVRELSGL